MSFARGDDDSGMTPPAGKPSVTDEQESERLEVHNASVDEVLAGDGACARVHLASGRVCLLPHDHGGSCEFTTPDQP